MPAPSAAEAYDWIRFTRVLRKRLLKVRAALIRQGRRRSEARWLSDAARLLDLAFRDALAHLEPARLLPELEDARADHALELREAWVRRLEKLVELISEEASPRSPMIETLFPHQKWKELYRAKPEPLRRYQLEFERRSGLGYVKRMVGTPEFAFLVGPLERTRAAFQKWEQALAPTPVPEAQAEAIRAGLIQAYAGIEQAVQRAKLLAQAALLAQPGAFEEAGLHTRPKRRSGKRKADGAGDPSTPLRSAQGERTGEPDPLAVSAVEPPAHPDEP